MKHGDENLSLALLLIDGITIEFSEPIQPGFIQISMEDENAPVNWNPKWGKDSVTLVFIGGGFLGVEFVFIIDIIVKDLAGNELADSVRFSTGPRLK